MSPFATGTLTLDGSILTYAPWNRSVEINESDLEDVNRILSGDYKDESDIAAVFQFIEHWRSRSIVSTWLRNI